MPRQKRIGLLGGSFNPAHDGHLYISREAMKRLALDEVWWLVSPGNPLKSEKDMAPYAVRLATARTISSCFPRIKVVEYERQWNNRYTVDTLTRLRKHHPSICFIWILGADNLLGFHRWKRWKHIAELVPIAVFDREAFFHPALRSKAATALARYRKNSGYRNTLALEALPAWTYLTLRKHPLSATSLRKTLGKKAFPVV